MVNINNLKTLIEGHKQKRSELDQVEKQIKETVNDISPIIDAYMVAEYTEHGEHNAEADENEFFDILHEYGNLSVEDKVSYLWDCHYPKLDDYQQGEGVRLNIISLLTGKKAGHVFVPFIWIEKNQQLLKK